MAPGATRRTRAFRPLCGARKWRFDLGATMHIRSFRISGVRAYRVGLGTMGGAG